MSSCCPYWWAAQQQYIGIGVLYGSPGSFYDTFHGYKSYDFGIFAQLYGGRYALFANHNLYENKGIADKTMTRKHINLTTLAINNGIYDAKFWYKADYDEHCLPCLNTCYDIDLNEACYNTFRNCLQ
ncbi:hypothetical protein HD806DRAFT_527816 [Xylariaceae sp. AK1471]|nr:hypothetical protein HD806DRAFT_527816 [Xylariaceae sp. AK1471]